MDPNGNLTYDHRKETTFANKPVLKTVSSGRCFSISVRRENGNTISLIAVSFQPISSLVAKISSKEGIPEHCQRLYFAGMRLRSHRSPSYYNICDGSILDLVVAYRGKLKIYVGTFSGSDDEKIPLDVDSAMKIREVKALIHLKKGIPVEHQKLVYFGEQLEDDSLLFDYDIREESPLLLVDSTEDVGLDMPIQIYVNIAATGKTINLQVKISDTIHDVKAKIQAEEDIPLDKQLLFLPRLRLDNNTSSLAECFIRDGSTLHLVQTTC